MSFVAPLMLYGGLAVTIPLALHFFYKARHRPLQWAAMKFLRLSVEQTSRRLRFQELILLILRCLALLLLALALARLSCVATSAAGRGEGVDAIFIFDTSFSMGAQDGEVTRIERAKTAARSIIDNLPPNSTVQIFTAAGADRAEQVKFTPSNLDQARNVVESIQLTNQSGDIMPGLLAAQDALDRTAGSNKEIYLFTDMQKSGWDRQAGAVRGKATEIKQRATLILVRCGNPERELSNLAVVDITIPESMPVADTRLPVTVHVKNTGKKKLMNIPVVLEVDGLKQDSDAGLLKEIDVGAIQPVSITAKLGKAGPRMLSAKIGAAQANPTGPANTNSTQVDDVPGDNTFHKLILVREKIRVLLVDGNPHPSDSTESGSHFLKQALVPVPESQRGSYFVKVTEVTAREAAATQLGDTDICILVNTPPVLRPGIDSLSTEFVNRLPQFVKSGGSLILSAGDFWLPAKVNESLGSKGNGLLPFDLTEPTTAEKDKPFNPAPDSAAQSSFLGRYRNPPYSDITARVDIGTYMGVDESVGGGQVLLSMTNGKPLICSKIVGDGEVLLFTTTLDGRWTNWPALAPSYVPLIRLALGHLTGKAIRVANRVAGEPLEFTPTDSSKAFEMEKPDKTRVQLGKAKGGDSGKVTLTTSDTRIAGEYLIGFEGENLKNGTRFAVTPDLKESENLENLNDAQVAEFIGFKPVMITAGGSGSDSEIGAERAKREWTIWILLALLLVVLAEAGWAWYCGKAW